MDILNKKALLQTKLKMTELQEFMDLPSDEKVTVIKLAEAAIILYLDTLGEFIGKESIHINKIN